MRRGFPVVPHPFYRLRLALLYTHEQSKFAELETQGCTNFTKETIYI
jgi:hypothetical protein